MKKQPPPPPPPLPPPLLRITQASQSEEDNSPSPDSGSRDSNKGDQDQDKEETPASTEAVDSNNGGHGEPRLPDLEPVDNNGGGQRVGVQDSADADYVYNSEEEEREDSEANNKAGGRSLYGLYGSGGGCVKASAANNMNGDLTLDDTRTTSHMNGHPEATTDLIAIPPIPRRRESRSASIVSFEPNAEAIAFQPRPRRPPMKLRRMSTATLELSRFGK